MTKATVLTLGIVLCAIALFVNILIPDPIPLLDEATMLGALIWLIRQKTVSEMDAKVVEVEVEEESQPGDPPKLTDG